MTMKPVWALVALASIAGCGKKADMVMYGNWEGDFRASQGSEDLKGYVQFYLNDHKFKMRLGTRSQAFDAGGTWVLKGDQALLTFKEFSFEGLTKNLAEERKIRYLPPDDIRTAYGRTLVLNLAPDHKQLTGLPMTIAGIEGTHSFHKLATSSYK